MRPSLMIASAAAVLACATPATAGHTWQIGSNAFNVKLDDLDLRAPAGRAQALGRIEAAASRLCRNAGVATARKACRDDVIAKAAMQPGAGFVHLALVERRHADMRLAQSKW